MTGMLERACSLNHDRDGLTRTILQGRLRDLRAAFDSQQKRLTAPAVLTLDHVGVKTLRGQVDRVCRDLQKQIARTCEEIHALGPAT
jgi:hypothetical protein